MSHKPLEVRLPLCLIRETVTDWRSKPRYRDFPLNPAIWPDDSVGRKDWDYLGHSDYWPEVGQKVGQGG